jgi:UDP-glucose 4-epimerase
VFVDDVVEANALALQKRPLGGYNIGLGLETDVTQLAHTLVSASGKKVDINHGPPRPGEQKRSVIDPKAYQNATGWQPKVGIDVGLRTTYAFFEKRSAEQHGI